MLAGKSFFLLPHCQSVNLFLKMTVYLSVELTLNHRHTGSTAKLAEAAPQRRQKRENSSWAMHKEYQKVIMKWKESQ